MFSPHSEAPLPFTSSSPNIGFHSSSEKSKIVVEKQNRVTAPGMMSPSSKSMPSPPLKDKDASGSASLPVSPWNVFTAFVPIKRKSFCVSN